MAEAVLNEINETIEKQMATIKVDKVLDTLYDLKDLLMFDPNPIMVDSKNNDKLRELARDNAQLLINQLFGEAKLETKVIHDAVVVDLPEKKTDNMFMMPREKPLPKKKAQTKWEAFAETKGIAAKKKKSRMLWDEHTQSFKPRWGYLRAAKAGEINAKGDKKDWVREVGHGEDPNQDPWAKEKKDKKERVAKNEHLRLKNIARGKGMTSKIKDPESKEGAAEARRPLTSDRTKQSKDELRESFRRAKTSTASMGNFDKQVKGEKKEKIGGKRKYSALFGNDHKDEQKNILDLMLSKSAKNDGQGMANKLIANSTGIVSKKKNKIKKKHVKRAGRTEKR